MSKILPPCIRGLDKFKKGCPEKCYDPDTGLGCPAWVDLELSTKGGQGKIIVKECLDLYMSRLQFYNNCLLEGNQQAIEGFRNGMVYKDNNGNVVPKPSNADIMLLNLLSNFQKRSNVQVDLVK